MRKTPLHCLEWCHIRKTTAGRSGAFYRYHAAPSNNTLPMEAGRRAHRRAQSVVLREPQMKNSSFIGAVNRRRSAFPRTAEPKPNKGLVPIRHRSLFSSLLSQVGILQPLWLGKGPMRPIMGHTNSHCHLDPCRYFPAANQYCGGQRRCFRGPCSERDAITVALRFAGSLIRG